MKLSLASAGVVAGLATLGWVIFGEQDTKNAEAKEKSWDDYPDEFVDEVYPYDSHPNADTYDMADVENQYRIWENKIADMEAEYQPNQTLEDYDNEGLTHSSAIDGYEPFKYSVMTSRAETLSKTSCCCGADEANPCICMKQPEPMQCSAKEPMCPCYKELAKAKMGAETLEAEKVWGEKIISGWSGSNLSKRKAESFEASGSNRWKDEMKVLCDAIMDDNNKRIHLKAYAQSYLKGGLSKAAEDDDSFQADSTCSWCKKESAKVRDVEYGGGGSICPNCHYAYRKLGYNPHKPQHPFKKSAEHKKMNPIEKPMIAGVTSRITADGLEDLMMAEDKATPIRHSRRANGYYGIKGYDDASEDGFIYRIYRSPGTNDWFKAMVYDDNSRRERKTGAKHTSRRLNPSGQMSITNDPAYLLIGAFPKFEDAKRALVFRMIQDGNYHHMITDGNLKWLLKGNR